MNPIFIGRAKAWLRQTGWMAVAALGISGQALAADKLVILSPHRKSIQDEFVPRFKEYYKQKYSTEVEVDWLDQGGTADDIKFLRAKRSKDPKTVGVDLFWGGGAAAFTEMANEGMLSPYALPADLRKACPTSAAGLSMTDKKNRWHATAISSFGIFFNRIYLKRLKAEEPKVWADLANPRYFGMVTLTDPRRSGTAGAMNSIVLHSLGWQNGWQLLTEIAGNTRSFTHSSSDPIKNVVAGDAAMAMAVDFYAIAKVADLGPEKLGFVLPQGQTVLDPDPIAIIEHAPNRKVAERFIDYVLSVDAQKILVLNLKQPDGPKFAAIGRMAVNTDAYPQTEGRRLNPFNPFQEKAMLALDEAKTAKTRRILDDLTGAILIDAHEELKAAWKVVSTKPADSKERKDFGSVPLTEADLLAFAAKWDDNVFRNQKMNEWAAFAKAKFQKIAAGKS
jgi:ABC-type Fe3+ transport system substrate-binding protein